jgi:hypothetical protein
MASKPEFTRGLGSTPSPFKINLAAASKDAKGKGAASAQGKPAAPSTNPRAQADHMQKQTGKGRGGRRKTG